MGAKTPRYTTNEVEVALVAAIDARDGRKVRAMLEAAVRFREANGHIVPPAMRKALAYCGPLGDVDWRPEGQIVARERAAKPAFGATLGAMLAAKSGADPFAALRAALTKAA